MCGSAQESVPLEGSLVAATYEQQVQTLTYVCTYIRTTSTDTNICMHMQQVQTMTYVCTYIRTTGTDNEICTHIQ